MTVLHIDGMGPVRITNWGAFKKQFLFLLGEELVNRIQDETLQLGLFDTGRFVRSIRADIVGDTLVLGSDAPYAAHLEFGTLELGLAFGDGWPDPAMTKKKHMTRSEARALPSGMQPFAPFRRVLLSQVAMERAMKAAAGGAQ